MGIRVLVAYASRHGSTREIAERIAAAIQAADIAVDVRPITTAPDAGAYDALVVGSSIYFGSWNKDAVRFLERAADGLRGRPVWLFSSGPVGNQPGVDPTQLEQLKTLVDVRDHRLFGGALKMGELSLGERLIAKRLRASGDSRDWPAIDDWAVAIRSALSLVKT